MGSCLGQELLDGSACFKDATFIFGNVKISFHRGVLAARSSFFDELFEREEMNQYDLQKLLPHGNIGCEAFSSAVKFLYTGKRHPPPTEAVTCSDEVCDHQACWPVIDFSVQLLYASFHFKLPALASALEADLCGILDKATVEDILPITDAAYRCASKMLLALCIERVAASDLDEICLEKELPEEVFNQIKALRTGLNEGDGQTLAAKRKIYRSVDKDDLELAKLLLSESKLTMNNASLLHYAVAYCENIKLVRELLALDEIDVNLKNSRGYAALHIAAIRRDPTIILALLERGANPLECTPDGRNAVAICSRRTTRKDDNVPLITTTDAVSDDDRVPRGNRHCLKFLRLSLETSQHPWQVSVNSLSESDSELFSQLTSREYRVGLARRWFPYEVEIAMSVANADKTSEFPGTSVSERRGGGGSTADGSYKCRLEALTKTVQIAGKYFPDCYDFISKMLENARAAANYLRPYEYRTKKIRNC